MAGVFWIGQNGKTYINTDQVGGGAQEWHAPLLSPQQMGLTQIDDPVNPPTSTAPSGGSGGTTAKALNTGAIDNTVLTIQQLPALLQAALEGENTRYGNTVNQFNAEEGSQRDTYGKSTTTNQQNYDATFMDSIRAGVKGLGGLMALLRGTGASGGSVDDQVRDTVGGVTAQDIRTGADTQKENQTTLDSTLSSFLTALGGKRRAAEDTRVNNERAIRRDNATQLQDLYGKMAGFYGDADRTADAQNWLSRAGSLTPEIAANSSTAVSAYDTTPVAVQAPQLTAFAGPTQPNVLAAPADGQVGSGIFTMTDRRKREAAPVLAPAGV